MKLCGTGLSGFLIWTTAAATILGAGCILDNGEGGRRTPQLEPGEGIRILKPYGGEIYTVGDTLVVEWLIDKSVVLNPLYVDLSTDAGKGFLPLIPDANNGIKTTDSSYDGNIGRFEWVITDSTIDGDGWPASTVSDQCMIGIGEVYASSESGDPWHDESDSLFTIQPK